MLQGASGEGTVVVLNSLPMISVARPKPLWQWMAVRMGTAAGLVIVLLAFLAVTSHKYASVGELALVVFGFLAVILAVETPLILRVLARRQQRLLTSSPPGTLFAAYVRQVGTLAGAVSGPASARSGLRPGKLLLNGGGVSFTPSGNRGLPYDTTLSWRQLSDVRLTPSPGSACGRLEVITGNGQVVSWVIPSSAVTRLIDVLDRVQAEHLERSG
jgi:hypothetical protein